MFLGYNTNGLAHHHPLDAIALLAEFGYGGVGLTIDHGLCSPRNHDWRVEAGEIRGALARHNLRSVVETGARFLLSAQVKHEPTLMSPSAAEREVRIAFLKHAIDVAAELHSDSVSFWSGILRDETSETTAFTRLLEALLPIVDYAAGKNVTLAFEPEPGMFIDKMTRYAKLVEKLDAPHFRLTLDIGHLHCQGETPIAAVIKQWGKQLANVHIEDMRAGVHEHLQFGAGEIDFPPVIAALAAVNYPSGLYVELSRHSHDGPQAARFAYEFLRPLLPK